MHIKFLLLALLIAPSALANEVDKDLAAGLELLPSQIGATSPVTGPVPAVEFTSARDSLSEEERLKTKNFVTLTLQGQAARAYIGGEEGVTSSASKSGQK